ncbi:hypothetical protein AS9A_3151 [Hoyosella subflava DQS3-9A1]|uniref:Uncharacterized protein n=2 Tax=Hoyosella TaxID=697025 RepID=F6EMN8_HOYSD|nr:hypothetical protein AS9A_3151 [Hoyosella subflava DQS3-9A1]
MEAHPGAMGQRERGVACGAMVIESYSGQLERTGARMMPEDEWIDGAAAERHRCSTQTV